MTPPSLPQVVSVRLPASLLKRIRLLAGEDGMTMSDWLRAAASQRVWERENPPAPPGQPRICGWSCQHLSITSLPGVMGKPTAPWCGCEMRPVYENAA